MPIPTEYQGKYFFHFTHVENLDSILRNGMLCTNRKNEENINHKNVASETIQDRRSDMDVTCGPGGKVHDYVPFYFTTRNPMLLGLVNRKNIDQPFIIFFAIPIVKLLKPEVVFTDASANTGIPPSFYDDPMHLGQLNWNAIDSKRWSSGEDEERHQRMAEVLIHDEVPIDWVTDIIVWNANIKEGTRKIFEKHGLPVPNIQYEPFKGKFFYFTKFGVGKDRGDETLVTGPFFLKKLFEDVQKSILKAREEVESFTFYSIGDALRAIEVDFCAIEELAGIYELETINDVHKDNVSDHTIRVVENLEDNNYYDDLSDSDQDIVSLSAYLHDIGKGPATKWARGIQPSYPDHPADSLKMLERILSEDIEDLSEDDIWKICLLVGYHDLIGDIVGRGRDKEELYNVVENENELNMLIALSLADVKAIDESWHLKLQRKIPSLIKGFRESKDD